MPELIGKLGYDGSGWTAGMAQAVGEAKQAANKAGGYFSQAFSTGGLASGLTGGIAGALGLGKALETVNHMAESLVEKFKSVKVGAAQLHTDVDTFQKIANITEKAGSGPETFATFVEHLAVSLEKIRNGEEGFEKLTMAAQELGVSIDDIQKKDALGIGLQILGNFQGTGDPSDELRAAMHKIGGRSANSLIAAGQIGLDSPTARAGNLSKEKFDAMDQEAKIDRFMAANTKAESQAIGGFWHEVGNVFSRFFYGALHPGAGEALLSEQEDEKERKEKAQEGAADRTKANKVAADKFIADKIAENQRAADLQKASELDKETARLKTQTDHEAEANRVAAMTPEARKKYYEDQSSKARQDEATNRHLADEAKYEGDREKDQAQFLNEAEKNRKTRLDAEKELHRIDSKPVRISESFDSLARIGGFTQNAGPTGLDMQQRMLTAAERTARNTDTLTQEQ